MIARASLAAIGRRTMILGGMIALGTMLSACGGGRGGGGHVASTPPPPPTPTPAPQYTLGTPVVNTSAPLVPGALTPSPALVEAQPGSEGFRGLTQTTVFPMLQTVAEPYTFAGDASATAKGGTVTAHASPGVFTFAVNSRVPPYSYTVGPHDHLEVDGETLDYTRFGNWVYYYPTEGPTHHGVWNIGFATPAAAVPTSGQATYTGKTTGFYDEVHPCGCSGWMTLSFAGDARLTADFGTRQFTGNFTNLAITGGFVPNGIPSPLPTPLNDVAFSGTISAGTNWFSGQTSVTGQAAGPQAFTPDAAGSITGMFYGPAANEVGGVWTLSDAYRRLIGSFGARGAGQ